MKTIFSACVLLSVYVTFAISQNLEEGTPCTTEGTIGVCKIPRSCPWAVAKIKARKYQTLVSCGWKGRLPVICCKSDRAPSNIKTATAVMPSTPRPPTDRKSAQACKRIKQMKLRLSLDDYIITGKDVALGEFPHMAAIGYSIEGDSNNYKYNCGGSLISKKFVLSAAHCAQYKNDQPKVVKLGRASTDKNDEKDRKPSQDILIKKVHRHPEYKPSKKYFDIALFELVSNAKFSRLVKPACLHTDTAVMPENQELLITGWGIINLDTREQSKWLQKSAIREVSPESCRTIFIPYKASSSLSEGIVKSQMCATGTSEGKIIDTCDGDSGGPLQYKKHRGGSEKQDVFYIVGVTSFGSTCGSSVPGIYSRVAEFLDWIESIVWPGQVRSRFGESEEYQDFYESYDLESENNSTISDLVVGQRFEK